MKISKELNQEEKKCSFKVNEGEDELTFYFSLDDAGYPIKLGDGTYGVVYKIYNSAKIEYAVKLLYNIKTVDTKTYESLVKTRKAPLNESPGIASSKNKDEEIFISAAVQRFKLEMDSARTIKSKLRELKEKSSLDGVVEIIGGTEKFTSSLAYKNLKDKFKEMQIDISDYALIMPLYDATLKDLLEKGKGKYKIRQDFDEKFEISVKSILDGFKKEIFSSKDDLLSGLTEILNRHKLEQVNIERLSEMASQNIYEVSGYDILETLDFPVRISTILPYLDDIATGLSILYRAEQFHYDMKPANIFIRSNLNKEIKAAIGDLGFLSIANTENTSALNIHQEVPLGTLHYRSPEQKDYFDLCEVDVIDMEDADVKRIDKSNSIKNCTNELENTSKYCNPEMDTEEESVGYLELIVHDPKFNNTIMEPGDYVVFTKDSRQIRHRIDKIDKKGDLTKIILKKSNEYLQNSRSDKKTQILLYKNHGVRTDLYGFGAIVYDMLTCGQSPERFYDNIRAYDNETDTIDNIKGLYQKVATYQLNEPRITNIFTCFKNTKTGKYAPIEIVEMILKCMLYRAKGTYYHESSEKENSNYEAIKLLRKELNTLLTDQKHNFNVVSARQENKLFLGESIDIKPSDDFKKVTDIFSRLQEMNKIEDIPLRLAQGIWYFSKLVDFIKEKIFNKHEEFIFAEMLPDNIRFHDDKFEFEYYLYNKKQEKYLDDMRNDDLYTKITRNSGYFFVPSKIAFIRREIDIFREKNAKDTFKYIFHDCSPFGDNVEMNDWIVYNKRLFRITNILEGKIIQLGEYKSNSNLLQNQNNDKFRCIYYSDLNPSLYYLNMLGIYLYQFFFVGIKNLTKSKPTLLNILESFSSLDNDRINDIKILELFQRNNESKKEKELASIIMTLTSLYLRLSLPTIKGSFYKDISENKKRILELKNWIQTIREMIAALLDMKRVELEDLQKEIASKDLREALKKIAPENLDINHWILECTNLRNVFKTKSFLGSILK